jgi:hypothetical protein
MQTKPFDGKELYKSFSSFEQIGKKLNPEPKSSPKSHSRRSFEYFKRVLLHLGSKILELKEERAKCRPCDPILAIKNRK